MEKEKIIFNIFKDIPVDIDIFKGIVKGRYKMDNYYEIYVEIINYQIDKYGCQLYDFTDYLSKRTGVAKNVKI